MQNMLLQMLRLPTNQPAAGISFNQNRFLAFLLLLTALFYADQATAQTIATIGAGAQSGTSSNSATGDPGPMYRSNATSNFVYSRYHYLYTQAELAAAGITPGVNITSLAWNKDLDAATNSPATFQIWIKNSAKTVVGAGGQNWADLIMGSTQVYNNTALSLALPAQWHEFVFSTPFLYTGGAIEISTNFDISSGSSPWTTAGFSWKKDPITDRTLSFTNATPPAATLPNLRTVRPQIRIMHAPAGPCTAPPTAGTATASATTICANTSFNLSLTGNSTGSGQTYQWETSPNGTTGWTAIGPAANTPQFSTTQAPGTHFYRAAVTCSGQTAFSSSVSVTSPGLVSGTFTINKNAPAVGTNFQSFAAAISNLACGINGPVVLNVVTGTGPYTEQIEIPQIGGASATNTITINGNSNTLNADPVTSNRAVILLNGADFVTIDSLTIATTGTTTTSFGWGIHFMNGANNNTISNNTITIGSLSITESNSAGIVFSNSGTSVLTTGDNGNNNIITGNTITGGYKGIILSGLAASPGNNQVTSNIIQDFYQNGIQLNGVNATLVEGNNISRPTRATVGTFYGIYMGGATQNTIVSKNRLHNSHGGATSLTGSVFGIYSTANDAPVGSENIVKNNLVYNINNGTGNINGLFNSGSDGVFYYHNTINLDNASHNGIARGLYQTLATTNLKLINNNISITTGGPAGSLQAIYLNTNTTVLESNNNNLYVPNGNIGYFNSDHATLAAWQAANPTAPYDVNSVSADPFYVNAAAGNLQPTSGILNNIGQPLAAVTDDITGAARSATTPDPGAYEFTAVIITPATPTITAGGPTTFCQGGSVVLTASSATPGVTYQWFNNAVAITGATSATYTATTSGSYTVRVNIGAGNSTSAATVVTVNPKPATPTITIPAGSTTIICQGSSLTLTGASATAGVTYRWSRNGAPIAGATASTYSATTAGNYRVIATLGTCSDSSAVTAIGVNPKPATPVITQTGTTLTSSAAGGNQWFSVSGAVLTPVPGATGAAFTPTATGTYTVIVTTGGCQSDPATAVLVTITGIASLAPGLDVSVYPNPTAGKFAVELTGFEKEATVQIMNVTGQVIASETVAIAGDKTAKAFDLGGMAKGVYILKVTSGNNLTFRKVILD